MIVGSANIETLAEDAATIESFGKSEIVFENVVCFQMTMEMRNQAREAVLPKGLHPTVPATLSMQSWEVGRSPYGEFKMVVCRVGCRSGVRARGYATRVYANTQIAVTALRQQFGFSTQLAEIDFRHSFDGTDLKVIFESSVIFEAACLDPEPMNNSDVQYTGALNLAHTPNGLRLVQLEAHHVASQVERLSTRLMSFDGEAWGNSLLDPYTVVSASLAYETVTFPPVRFVCKPDELAFTGTESV